MMATLVHISSTSSMWWLDNNTVSPEPASRWMRVRMSRMPAGSSPLVGSSSTSRPGPPNAPPATPRPCPRPHVVSHPQPLPQAVGVLPAFAPGPVHQLHDTEPLVDPGGAAVPPAVPIKLCEQL